MAIISHHLSTTTHQPSTITHHPSSIIHQNHQNYQSLVGGEGAPLDARDALGTIKEAPEEDDHKMMMMMMMMIKDKD